jgi:hypothetical protein
MLVLSQNLYREEYYLCVGIQCEFQQQQKVLNIPWRECKEKEIQKLHYYVHWARDIFTMRFCSITAKQKTSSRWWSGQDIAVGSGRKAGINSRLPVHLLLLSGIQSILPSNAWRLCVAWKSGVGVLLSLTHALTSWSVMLRASTSSQIGHTHLRGHSIESGNCRWIDGCVWSLAINWLCDVNWTCWEASALLFRL